MKDAIAKTEEVISKGVVQAICENYNKNNIVISWAVKKNTMITRLWYKTLTKNFPILLLLSLFYSNLNVKEKNQATILNIIKTKAFTKKY